MNDSQKLWFRPPELSTVGVVTVRLLFAFLVWYTVPAATALKEQPHPVGLARVFDLTFLANPGVLPGIKWVLIPVLMLYVTGRLPLLATGLTLLATVLPGTLDNSQGATQHSQQVISLILLAQFLYHLYCALCPDPERTLLERGRWSVFMGQQAIVAAYTVTALTKLFRSGFGWVVDSANFPIQMVKNIQMQYYNTLEPETVTGFWATTSAKVQEVFLASPNLCRALLTSGLLLELLAVLALLGRRWAAAYGLLLIVFHLLVRTMTGLNFRFHIAALFIFLIYPLVAHWLAAARAHLSATQRGQTAEA